MMSNKDKATMALHYIANHQLDACNELFTTVPVVDRKDLDPEFSAPYGTGLFFAVTWGNEYWKTIALRMTALCKYFAEKDKYGEVAQENAQDHSVFESRLLAIDEALNVVCSMYGIFPGDVRKLASNAIEFEPLDQNVKPDEQYKDQLVTQYLAMMNAWPGNYQQKSVPGESAH